MAFLNFLLLVAIYKCLNPNALVFPLMIVGLLFYAVHIGMRYFNTEDYKCGYLRGFEDAKEEMQKHTQ